MALEDIKNQLVETVQAKWSEFQETSLYINIKEKYDGLSTPLRKLVLSGVGLLLLIFILMPPYLWWSSSSATLEDFEDKRTMLRDLLGIKRDMVSETGSTKAQISAAEIKTKVASILDGANLVPDQIKENFDLQISPQKDSLLIPATFTQSGIKLTLNKLNLRQIVDLSYRFQTISPMVKIPHFEVVATPEDPHYYRASWQIVAFEVAAGSASTDTGSGEARGRGGKDSKAAKGASDTDKENKTKSPKSPGDEK